jgi:hypothetical protein
MLKKYEKILGCTFGHSMYTHNFFYKKDNFVAYVQKKEHVTRKAILNYQKISFLHRYTKCHFFAKLSV